MPASLILHAVVAVLLVYNLPSSVRQPDEEQPINVALVAPPEQPKPKPAPVASPKETKAEKPPEQAAQKPPLAEQPRKQPPMEVLRPVYQFGDKDTGPRKSLDGASAQVNAPSPSNEDTTKSPTQPSQVENQPVSAVEDAAPLQHAQKQAISSQNKEAEAQEADKQTPEELMPPAAGGDDAVELPESAEAPKPKPANAPKPSQANASNFGAGSAKRSGSADASRSYSGLPGVRLYSQNATDDALAMTAMAGVPRGERIARLCGSAMLQQLLGASYVPDLLPVPKLKVGNIVDNPHSAFHAAGTWHRLSYRCEVDADATKVLSFDFNVGAVIPPNEGPP